MLAKTCTAPEGPPILRIPRAPRAYSANLLTRPPFLSENQINEIAALVRRVRHDANSPITAALGNVQLLLEDPAVTDPEVRESLQIVESELRRLIEILKQLNAIRPESG